MEQIVAVVGILKKDNYVLLSTRPEGKSHTGCWEFPGGKIEPNEEIQNALVRELAEEIGVLVKATDCKFIKSIVHEYKDRRVRLHLMLVENWEGDPAGYEGQELYWQNLSKKCELEPLLPTTQMIFDLLITKGS